MKALSIKQPWAHWIATGVKTIETRTWRTHFRGEVLICISKAVDGKELALFDVLPFGLLLGHAVAVTYLADCRPMTPEDGHAAMYPWAPGRWAWVLEGTRPIRPFAVKGQLGLFEVAPPAPLEFLALHHRRRPRRELDMEADLV